MHLVVIVLVNAVINRQLYAQSTISKLIAKDKAYDSKDILVEKQVSSLIECLLSCQSFKGRCRSLNFIKRNGGNVCQVFKSRLLAGKEELKELEGGSYFEPQTEKVSDCKSIQRLGYKESGIYHIYISDKEVEVFCDMETDGGGWIVFQNRFDGSVDFNKKWEDYKNGFGDVENEFWLGNEHVHQLTNHGKEHELWIEGEKFNGEKKHTKFSGFSLESENNNYRIPGTTTYKSGHDINDNNFFGLDFTTFDKDNDRRNGNCATVYGTGGWWYDNCYAINFNGVYLHVETPENFAEGIIWESWTGFWTSLKKTKMMFR